MKSLCFALAVDMSELRALQRTSPAKTGLGLVLAAISGVVAIFVLWAVFFRKRRDETMRRYREHFSSANAKESSVSSSSSSSGLTRRKRRRRRRENAQRNPTRAEMGGLPPVRDDWPAEDPP